QVAEALNLCRLIMGTSLYDLMMRLDAKADTVSVSFFLETLLGHPASLWCRGNTPTFGWLLRIQKILEARGGIEPPVKVLQTFALPLGYRASALGLLVPEWREPQSSPRPSPAAQGKPNSTHSLFL